MVLAILAACAVGISAAHATIGFGPCGYYDDIFGNGSEYRLFGVEQSVVPPDTSITATIVLKNLHVGGAGANDFEAVWDMMADPGTSGDDYHVEAGINVGNGNPGNSWTTPELYVETKDAGGYAIHNVATAPFSGNSTAAWVTRIQRTSSTSKNYYVTFTSGGTSYRYPTSVVQYISEPVALENETWNLEEQDKGEATLTASGCPFVEGVESAISYDVTGSGDFSQDPNEPPNQAFWQLKSWSSNSFDVWQNNCFYQGKCQGPVR